MAYFGKAKEKRLINTYQVIVLSGLLLLTSCLWVAAEWNGRPFVALLLFLLPSVAWAGSDRVWQKDKMSGEAILLSAAGTLAMLLAAILAINLFIGAVSQIGIIAIASLLSCVPIGADYLQGSGADYTFSQLKKEKWLWFLLPLAIALALRLPWFGYREIQGDEGIVLVRAADALLGDGQELLLHRKGPMEILLVMGVWGLTEQINDFWVRLPFLLCNLFSLALFYRLSDRWFGRRTAVLASCFLAIVGFHVTFSRVVQYQSLVMMWGIGATLAAERYRSDGKLRDLILASILLAAGLLSHYDAILFSPAIIALVIGRWLIEKRIRVSHLSYATGIGFILIGLFYIPFLFGPDFQNAVGYLLNERVDTSAGGSLGDVWQMATFYNSSWAILGFIGFGLIGLAALWQSINVKMVKVAAIVLLGVPLLFYTVIVSVPRTHVYTFFPGLVLLSALGAEAVADYLRPWRTLFQAGIAAFTLWFCLCAAYIGLLFTWGPGEVQRNWETNRPNPILYWTTWDTPPAFGLFGFPYQAGWRQMGQSDLTGLVYASNEEEEITNWYMSQATRTHCNTADLFLLAKNVQDPIVFDPILMSDKREIDIGNNLSLFAQDAFYFQPGSRMVAPAEVSKPLFGGENSLEINFGEEASLAGYDLIPAEQGTGMTVVLYWHAHTYFERNYQAFVHVTDQNGDLIAQHDSAPECGINPTTRWEPGTIIRDPHPIILPANWPVDQPVRILAGMYDLITQERLLVDGGPINFAVLNEKWLVDAE